MKTLTIRAYPREHQRVLDLCIEADKDAAQIMRETFDWLDRQAEQIRYLQIDRAALLRDRNRFERKLLDINKACPTCKVLHL